MLKTLGRNKIMCFRIMRLQRKAQAKSRAERTSETAAHRVERNSTSMLGSEH
jgi:hypothetical protein